jgi:DNA-binding XRE family transcriptional regulator
MITTHSGIHLQEGLVASQCLENYDQLKIQNEEYALQPILLPQAQTPWNTFAFPSHQIMLRLLAVFSGKTKHLPEKYLSADTKQINKSESQRIKNYVNAVLQQTVVKETYNELNELIQKSEHVAIISNNPLVEGWAKIPEDLFADNLEKREEELAIYINKTFGAEGLRHLLGLVIGLEENGRKGDYHFTINEHLDRLGYKRSKKGAHDPSIKWKSFRIIQVLSSLHLILSSSRESKQKVTCIKLFSLDRYDIEQETDAADLIHMSFVIRANKDWYGTAFEKTDDRSQQYTQLLKKVATESHQDHSLAIYLAIQFAIRWRINKFRPFSLKVQTIMDLCCLDHTPANRTRRRDLRNMEAELNYMTEANYLGGWHYAKGREGLDSFALGIQFDPPSWLGKYLHDKVRMKIATPIVTADGLKWIQRQASLNQNNLAETLGVSRQHISNIYRGRTRISAALSRKINDIFGNFFTEM